MKLNLKTTQSQLLLNLIESNLSKEKKMGLKQLVNNQMGLSTIRMILQCFLRIEGSTSWHLMESAEDLKMMLLMKCLRDEKFQILEEQSHKWEGQSLHLIQKAIWLSENLHSILKMRKSQVHLIESIQIIEETKEFEVQ